MEPALAFKSTMRMTKRNTVLKWSLVENILPVQGRQFSLMGNSTLLTPMALKTKPRSRCSTKKAPYCRPSMRTSIIWANETTWELISRIQSGSLLTSQTTLCWLTTGSRARFAFFAPTELKYRQLKQFQARVTLR